MELKMKEKTDTGLACKMCGKCCFFEIPITLLDIHRMAKYLGMAEKEVFEDYVQKKISHQCSLFMIRKNKEGACVFLTEHRKCSIHNTKPRACGFYKCTLDSNKEVLPWTATCSHPAARAELWEQSIAAAVTKAYIKKNGVTWNDGDYEKAISGICDNIAVNDRQKIKMAKNKNGAPLVMIYDCSLCPERGMWAKETPITLDDIRRITAHCGLTWKAFFQEKIDSEPSKSTGCLKLVRRGHCVFFHRERHCTIKEVRPMHCRFTPCPKKTQTADMMDSLYLGSETVEEQFRHQVAMALTRQYVAEYGARYNKYAIKNHLKATDRLVSDRSELETFCKKIAPYRYVDDTLPVLQHTEKGLSMNACNRQTGCNAG
jgi:Fe-S-cluster containining protein